MTHAFNPSAYEAEAGEYLSLRLFSVSKPPKAPKVRAYLKNQKLYLCMYISMYVSIVCFFVYAYMHLSLCMYICVYVSIMYVSLCMHAYVTVYICMYVSTYLLHISLCMHTCLCHSVCVYVCARACVYGGQGTAHGTC